MTSHSCFLLLSSWGRSELESGSGTDQLLLQTHQVTDLAQKHSNIFRDKITWRCRRFHIKGRLTDWSCNIQASVLHRACCWTRHQTLQCEFKAAVRLNQTYWSFPAFTDDILNSGTSFILKQSETSFQSVSWDVMKQWSRHSSRFWEHLQLVSNRNYISEFF